LNFDINCKGYIRIFATNDQIMSIKNKWITALGLLVMVIGLTCCKLEESLPSNIQLIASPDTLVLSDTAAFKEIFLSTRPKGSVDYVMTDYPSWLRPSKTEGTLGDGINSIRLVPNVKGMNQGVYHSKVSFISDFAGTAVVEVYMNVGSHPVIGINQSALSFSADTKTVSLKIKNTGTGMLEWSIGEKPAWLSFSNSGGYLLKGEEDVVVVECNQNGMNADTYTYDLKISSNSEKELAAIPVQMVVPEIVRMEALTTSILFDYFSTRKTVLLTNIGNQSVNWSVASKPSYFSVSPASGTLAKGDTTSITINIDRSSLTTGVLSSNLVFKTQLNEETKVPVTTNHYKSNQWILDRAIIDAEYDKTTDKLIIVSTSPNRLSIINPETKAIESIDLSTTPRCVSVNAEGTIAVVGHNGYVTYVDLTNKKVLHIWPITCDAWDITFGKNNWCYVTPNEDQWESVYSMNGETGAVTLTGSIYEKTLVKSQPNSNYIYLSNTVTSSSALEKFATSANVASYLYENFDSDTGGKFWFSNDGTRIFSSNKRTYSASEIKASDMLYRGSVESTSNIYWVDHSAAAKKVFTIGTESLYSNITNSKLDYYNDTYLNYLGSISFEQFMIPSGTEGGRLYNAEGKYVFANKTGTRVYAIVQANSAASMAVNWAIQGFDIGQ